MKGQEIVGETAASLLDLLDESTDETAEIREVLIVTLITTREDDDGSKADEDDLGWSFIQWRASEEVWTHQVGLLEGCLEGMRKRRSTWHEDTGDDPDE